MPRFTLAQSLPAFPPYFAPYFPNTQSGFVAASPRTWLMGLPRRPTRSSGKRHRPHRGSRTISPCRKPDNDLNADSFPGNRSPWGKNLTLAAPPCSSHCLAAPGTRPLLSEGAFVPDTSSKGHVPGSHPCTYHPETSLFPLCAGSGLTGACSWELQGTEGTSACSSAVGDPATLAHWDGGGEAGGHPQCHGCLPVLGRTVPSPWC